MFNPFRRTKKPDTASAKTKKPEPNNSESENKSSKILKALYSWVMVLLGLLVLLSVQTEFFQKVHEHTGKFIEELAFALILAGLFSLTVEKYHREEFQKFVIVEREKLKKDVFLYAYGHAIAEQTRREIKESILDCFFQRDRLRLEWHFAPVDGDLESVRLTKIVTYTQRNATKQPQKYEYRLQQNTTPSVLAQVAADQRQHVRIRRSGGDEINLEKNHQHFTGDEIAPEKILQLTTDQIGFLQPDEELDVAITITEKRPRIGDDSYSSKHPIVGITSVSIYIEAGLDLTASAYCKGKPLTVRPESSEFFRSWETKEGLLPYQGVMVSWSPGPPKLLPESTSAVAP